MNILITGSSGFVGTNLIIGLLKRKHKIFASYYKTKPKIKNKRVTFKYANLEKKDDCLKITKNIDYVFMCAANSSGAKVMAENPLAHFTPNIIINTNMIDACHKNNVKKFIFISSSTVYPLTKRSVSESDAKFNFFYKYYIVGWMKRFAEITCDIYRNKITKTMKTIIVRPGNLYGIYDKFNREESKVIPAIMRRIIERENPITVWGKGNDLKDFLYIEDFIDALLKVSFSKKNIEVINIASGKVITIKKVLREILSIEKYEPKIYFDKTKPILIPKRSIDISYLKKNFKWKQKTKLNIGLKKTINWYKNFYKNKTPEEIE